MKNLKLITLFLWVVACLGTPGFGTPGFGTPGFGTPGFGTPGFGTLSAYENCCSQEDAFADNCSSSCMGGYSFEGLFRALYLLPSGSDLYYAAEAIPLPLPSPNWFIEDIRPEYHFGFDVGLKATFL